MSIWPARSLLASTSLTGLVIAGIAAMAMAPLALTPARAADFIPASGAWGSAANWTPATVPDSVDAVATFTAGQGLSGVVDLAGGSYTVGTLNLNATGTSGGYQIGSSSPGGVLNFEASGQAEINVQTNNADPDLAANASFNLVSGTVFTVGAGAHFTADGVISGAGGLTKVGGGLLTLNGANTYTGGTLLSEGTLSLGNDNALGTAAISASPAGTIDLQDGVNISNYLFIDVIGTVNVGSGTGTYSGQISEFEVGTLVKTGAGTLVLTSYNYLSGGVRITGGTVQVTDDHAAGTGPITLEGTTFQAGANLALANVSFLFGAAGGTIDTQGFDVSTSASMGDNDIPGGTFIKKGTGTLTVSGFANNNTYGTATRVAEGTLKAGDANIFSANSAYTVASGATLALDTFDQAIGSLADVGASGGTVDVGSATLTTGGNNSSTKFSGVIKGSGGLVKTGTGVFELAGLANSLSGATTVQAGTLLVTGLLGDSDVTVKSGATLAGGGTIGGLHSLGTVAPGKNAVGTLTVLGNATFEASSNYTVDLNPTTSDLIAVSGTADIAGTLTIANLASGVYAPGTRYAVLSAAGGRNGTFTLSSNQLSYFLGATAAYDPTHVYIDITKTSTFSAAGLTPNQIATGAGLESLSGGSMIDALLGLPTAAAVHDAYDQLSGEIHSSARGMLVQDSHFLQDAVTARLRAAFDGVGIASLPVMAYGEGGPEMVAADSDRFAVWGQGFGSWGGTGSDGNAAAFNRSATGLLMGADGMASDWRIGAVGGYSRSSFDVDDRHSSGDSANYHLGLYGGTNWGAIAFRTGAAYTRHRISTSRSVAFGNFTDQLSADYDAATAQAFGELAYKTDAGPFAFEPFANLAYVNLHTDGFAETGGAAALTSSSSTTDATFTTLGVRASTDVTVGGVTATARGMFGWRHAFGQVAPLSSVAFAGSNSFIIAGAPIARDAMLAEVGFDVQLAANATLGLSYAGQFGADAFDNGFKANLGMKF
ncbi:MAG: autotransporter domain-containing protein [Mesorhizobium sp.]